VAFAWTVVATTAYAANDEYKPLTCAGGDTGCATLNSQLSLIAAGSTTAAVKAPLPCAPDGACSSLRSCSQVLADLQTSIEAQAEEEICAMYQKQTHGVCNVLEKDVAPRNTHCGGPPYMYINVDSSPDYNADDRGAAMVRAIAPQAFKKAVQTVLNEVRTNKYITLPATSGAQPLGVPYMRELYTHLNQVQTTDLTQTIAKNCAQTGAGAGKICSQDANKSLEVVGKVQQLDCRISTLRSYGEQTFGMMMMTRIFEEAQGIYSTATAEVQSKTGDYMNSMKDYVDSQDCWSKSCGRNSANSYYRNDDHLVQIVIGPVFNSPNLHTDGNYLLPDGPSCGSKAMGPDGPNAHSSTVDPKSSSSGRQASGKGGASGFLALFGGILGAAGAGRKRRFRIPGRTLKAQVLWACQGVAVVTLMAGNIGGGCGSTAATFDVCPDGKPKYSNPDCKAGGDPSSSLTPPPAATDRGAEGISNMDLGNGEVKKLNSKSNVAGEGTAQNAATAGSGTGTTNAPAQDGAGSGLANAPTAPGGGKGGGSGAGGGGGGGLGLGSVSTAPAGLGTVGTGLDDSKMAATAAYSGGGPAKAPAKGGKGNDPLAALRNLGAKKEGTAGAGDMDFGAKAGDVNPMASDDPDDYFGRIQAWESIFKIVERRYKTKEQSWALTDSKH